MNNENVGAGKHPLAENEPITCESLVAFSKKFAECMEKARRELPYHLNIIDELHDHENAHSRILLRLLQFVNENGELEIYRSLLDYIKERQSGFSRISIEEPRMTQEKARIDLWVRDKGYAIIFENKIYNAPDQEAQLARYIKETIAQPGGKYKVDKNIFVIYLSSDGQEPTAQSWVKVDGDNKIDYKPLIGNRCVNLSYRNDIYQWLKEKVLLGVRYKDVYLQTALVQYIDYLEGRFYIRETEKQMNKKMKELIEREFGLEDASDTKRMQKLEELFQKQHNLLDFVWKIKESERERIFANWKQATQEKFKVLDPNAKGYDLMESVTHVIIDAVAGTKVAVYIGWQDGKLFCQAESDYHLPEDKRNIRKNDKLMGLKDILPEEAEDGPILFGLFKWMGQDYDATYELFCKVVQRCLEMRDKQA